MEQYIEPVGKIILPDFEWAPEPNGWAWRHRFGWAQAESPGEAIG